MDAARATAAEPHDARFDGLHAEAKAALAYTANTLRAVRDRYRTAYLDELTRWQTLRDELDRLERPLASPEIRASLTPDGEAAEAAEAGAADARLRYLRSDVGQIGSVIGAHEREISKLDLAIRGLETTWLFLEPGDTTLVGGDAESAGTSIALQMRIIEAQEAERSRLAQEVHDGPAQALWNAIFQVEYIERIVEQDVRVAKTELGFLRELLRRELGDVRSFVSQLRPPVLDQLGLDGAITDSVDNMHALTRIPMEVNLTAGDALLTDAEQTVALRVLQEALHNVRKHAAARQVSIGTAVEDDGWVLELRDNGRGFDIGAVAARGRRNFGLQVMQERADLIGARLEIRSRPEGGTVVRLAIPIEGREAR